LRYCTPRARERTSPRDGRLGGKVALVTGAQQGIGRAIAVALAREGADVGVNYLDDRDAAEQVVAEVHGAGRRAFMGG
jgi:NAD(P)-dependent dehydrogenase (short-subunit alcohol dehydrogenase family)